MQSYFNYSKRDKVLAANGNHQAVMQPKKTLIVEDEIALQVERKEKLQKLEEATRENKNIASSVLLLPNSQRKRIEFVPAKNNDLLQSESSAMDASSSSNGLGVTSNGQWSNNNNNHKHASSSSFLYRDINNNGEYPKSWEAIAKKSAIFNDGRPSRGILNLGTTCFLSAILQALTHCVPFINELVAWNKEYHSKNGSAVDSDAIDKVANHLSQAFVGNVKQAVNPKVLLQSIRSASNGTLRANRQEDAHEALRILLEDLQRSALRRHKLSPNRVDALAETTLIHRVFGGTLLSETRCPSCKYSSKRYDSYLDLSLDIKAKGEDSIRRIFSSFFREEQLDKDNLWTCEQCKSKVRAIRALSPFKNPQCLVLHFKRFGFGYQKLKTQIPCDKTIMLGNDSYDLFASVVHYGFSARSGHYIARVKAGNGFWYEMDDDVVRKIKVESVFKEKDGYLLFYEKRGRPSSPPPPLLLGGGNSKASQNADEEGGENKTLKPGNYYSPASSNNDVLVAESPNNNHLEKSLATPPPQSPNNNTNNAQHKPTKKNLPPPPSLPVPKTISGVDNTLISSSPRSLTTKRNKIKMHFMSMMALKRIIPPRRSSAAGASSIMFSMKKKKKKMAEEKKTTSNDGFLWGESKAPQTEHETEFSFASKRIGVSENEKKKSFAERKREYDVVDQMLDAGKRRKIKR